MLDIRCLHAKVWGPGGLQLECWSSVEVGLGEKIDLYHALLILASGGGGQRLISAATFGLFGMSESTLCV